MRSDEMPQSAEVASAAPKRARGAAWRRWALLIVVSVVAVLAFVVERKSALQTALVPIVLLAAWRARFFRERIPRAVFGAAICGVLVGAVGQFSHIGLARGGFLVAGGRQWDLNQETKIYRDRIKRALGPSRKNQVGMLSGSISSRDEALKLLSDREVLGGIIWGGSRWITVTLRPAAPLALSEFPEGSAARALISRNRVSDLRIIRGVSYVGLSHGNEDATVHFLAKLIPLWRSIPEVIRPNGEQEWFEVAIQSLARMQARWSSRAHLALPMWIAGTERLVRALEQPTIDGGDLACAIRDIELAEAQFRPKDNMELQAAVRNNLAIALLAQSDLVSNERELRKSAADQFAQAKKASKSRKDPNAVAIIANRDTIVASRGRAHGRRK